ncbi:MULTISPECIES: methionyl-tRNA formyltransferase [Clostridia]|uniref:methionyl-tRNA formyltransferase n=1 Tax=Clostridia TaxID=186801 RepID=UPI000EA11E80|nr:MULTISPECIES: methionyl-tRNA formyltransferase [Clostridia]NBJ68454.1 methionyl-tRNA formyltransferase [Roseburia sp. 1XD42-34]RKI81215.1 methionyl-tRNA formyltransferase [Clostridium sp. 1xD42-85]
MKRIVFMGTPDFAVPILKTLVASPYDVVLVVTQPDRPKGRKRVVTPPPVKQEAIKHDIPVFQPEKLKDDYEAILAYEPDLIVTAAYGQLLPNQLLTAPPYGCINIHASLLPELRGGAPIHYAIMQGKTETGVTIMYMVEKLDAGAMLTHQKVMIEENDHVGSLHDKLAEAGSQLLEETLPKLFANELQPIEQEHDQASFAHNIKREQEEIDWNQPSGVVYNHVRGLHPWPVAYTIFQGKPMKIWWGEPIDKVYDGKAGEVVDKPGNSSFIIACGDKKGFRVTEIQPAGKKRMTVKDYLQGNPNQIQIGQIMGE